MAGLSFGYAKKLPNGANGTTDPKADENLSMEERLKRAEAERDAANQQLSAALEEIKCLRQKIEERTKRRRTGDL